MPSIQVKLIRSWAGTPARHRQTLEGLGLYKINDVSVLPATAATLGMVRQVSHIVMHEQLAADFKPKGRRHVSRNTNGKKKS